jgi:huntingtin
VSAVLQTFATVMEYSAGHNNDLGKHVEEYLTYVKSCMAVAPRPTLVAVQSLLRCLFRHNIPFMPAAANSSNSNNMTSSCSSSLAFPRLQTSPSIFEAVISVPYAGFTLEHGLNLEASDMMSSSSVLGGAAFRPTGAVRRPSERTSLASYIRLFEPMVIKALKHYTVSCQVRKKVSLLLYE